MKTRFSTMHLHLHLQQIFSHPKQIITCRAAFDYQLHLNLHLREMQRQMHWEFMGETSFKTQLLFCSLNLTLAVITIKVSFYFGFIF